MVRRHQPLPPVLPPLVGLGFLLGNSSTKPRARACLSSGYRWLAGSLVPVGVACAVVSPCRSNVVGLVTIHDTYCARVPCPRRSSVVVGAGGKRKRAGSDGRRNGRVQVCRWRRPNTCAFFVCPSPVRGRCRRATSRDRWYCVRLHIRRQCEAYVSVQ
jgi:hypothetical protein